MNAPAAIVAPDYAQARRFFRALFPIDAWVHLRAVPEPKDGMRRPTNHHYQTGPLFDEALDNYLDYCFVDSRAAFFLPAIVRPGKTHKDAVEAFTCILIDFDKGDAQKNLMRAEAELGPATIIVESGGATEFGNKLHAYWLLPDIASDPAAIEAICKTREALAEKFGGDPSFKQEAQVIRIPGSVHFKNGPRMVKLIRCP
jgi:hypothetical protein